MLFDAGKLLLIAGPCALESREVVREAAAVVAKLGEDHPELSVVFKGSYDKANRTSLTSPRGPGLDAGLELLREVQKEFGLPVLTDVHSPEEARRAGEVCEVLQVPAFLCRQTDLLVACAETGRVVNVKKGQFLSPAEMRYVVDKLTGAGAAEIWQTERGTTFGYQNLVVDMRSFPMLAEYGHPTVFDATHSVQLPGAGGGKTSGQRQFVPCLSRAALAAGAQGLFVETHPDPEQAISDGPNQVPTAELPALVEGCLKVWRAVR